METSPVRDTPRLWLLSKERVQKKNQILRWEFTSSLLNLNQINKGRDSTLNSKSIKCCFCLNWGECRIFKGINKNEEKKTERFTQVGLLEQTTKQASSSQLYRITRIQ